LFVVGYAEMSADKNAYYISKAALMDAESKLISDAPSEIRIITQNALTGAGIDSSEFMQIQTKLQEVIGLTSLRPEVQTCRKFLRYGESTNRVTRACWHQASVNVFEVKKAYTMTLRAKYGDGKANKFDDLMSDELKKINNKDRFKDKPAEKQVTQQQNVQPTQVGVQNANQQFVSN
jgi:hypothetical protein